MRSIFILSTFLVLNGCLESVKETVSSSSVPLPEQHPAVDAPMTGSAPQKSSNLANGTMMLGSRFFVGSVFKNIFFDPNTMSSGQLKSLNDLLDGTIHKNPDLFGGAPNIYSTRGLKEIPGANCGGRCSNEDLLDLPLMQPSTPARSVILSKACQSVLDNTVFFGEALKKIQINITYASNNDFDSQKINDVYKLFYLDDLSNETLKTSLLAAAQEAKRKGFSKLDQWRLIYLMICESGYWQIL